MGFSGRLRINDEITLPLWKGIIAFLEKMEQKNFFAESYPEGCMDNQTDIWSTDTNKLSDELEIYTELTWPLKQLKSQIITLRIVSHIFQQNMKFSIL
jgi:hypothetical protein